ncbi:MAG: amino acid permease, partial [Pseudomonas sp.]|nr:amino acid permease [Pseudomonas sp.]
LPKRWFGRLSTRFGTPVISIVLCGVVALLALRMDVTTSTSFINFGAFLAFSLVNLSVIFHYWIAQGERGLKAAAVYLAFPLVGLMADLWLMASLDPMAIYLGVAWLGMGCLYLLVITRGLRQQPPEMHFEEA